ncbi:MAG: heavy-metal-associated domain-containing protein [Hyphomonas sp.]|nr:heavy-metal-associated domain-containing protein [Hyphomonas sp.]
MRFHIENMACGGCARSVTKAIQSVDPAAKVATSQETRTIEVASNAPVGELISVLKEAGYPAKPVEAV